MGALGIAGYLVGGLLEPDLRVDAERCLRTSGSTCRACVDSCPAGALLAPPEGARTAPQPTPSQCVDCGLCVPECPSGAVQGVGARPGALAAAAGRAGTALVVACAPARRQDPELRDAFAVECLASLPAHTVVSTALALDPGARLSLTRADCASCPLAQGGRVRELAREAAGLLHQLDTTGRNLTWQHAQPADPAQAGTPERAVPRPPRPPAQLSRRALFTGWRPRPPSHDRAGQAWTGAPVPGRAPGGPELGRLTPRPVSAEGCTFCAACVAVCPSSALRIGTPRAPTGPADGPAPAGTGPRPLALAVDAATCVGCGRCAEVCPEGVLGIGCELGHPPGAATPAREGTLIALTQGVLSACDRCGHPLAPGEWGRCQGCAVGDELVADVLGALDPLPTP